MKAFIRLKGFVLTVTLMFMVLFGLLSAASTGAQEPDESDELLHEKSRAGLMPSAYASDPAMEGRMADPNAPSISFLNPYSEIEVGSWPQVIAAADFYTGNGLNEAATGTAFYFDAPNDEQLHLFGGNPLVRMQQLEGGWNPEAMVALDVNLDGRQDVVMALSGDEALLVYTQTDEGLGEPVTIPLAGAPNALAVGDFNGDLHHDLVAVAPLEEMIHFWASSESGLVELPLTLPYPTGGYDALAVGDFDNDGDDDLAALRGAGYATDSVVIHLQQAGTFPESFTLSPETGGYLPHSVAVGDVNNDALDDVVVTAGGNAPDAYVNVFLQVSPTITTTPVVYDAFHLPTALEVEDLNHDGRHDVTLVNDGWRNLSFYEQNGGGTLNEDAVADLPYASRYRPDALALADLDGNGSLDVATVSYYVAHSLATATAP